MAKWTREQVIKACRDNHHARALALEMLEHIETQEPMLRQLSEITIQTRVLLKDAVERLESMYASLGVAPPDEFKNTLELVRSW